MNETDPQVAAPEAEQVPADGRPASSVDMANRPNMTWLSDVESELNDTDLVLKCLARDLAKICQTCDAAQSAGDLADRPMLARCASTKQPR